MSILYAVSSWLPVLVWASIIFYLSSIPSLQSGFGAFDFILRKTAHIVEFAVLTGLLIRALRRSWQPMAMKWLLALSAAASILYAISDEIHQHYVPGRGPSVVDVLIDTVGIALCLFIYHRRVLQKEFSCAA